MVRSRNETKVSNAICTICGVLELQQSLFDTNCTHSSHIGGQSSGQFTPKQTVLGESVWNLSLGHFNLGTLCIIAIQFGV